MNKKSKITLLLILSFSIFSSQLLAYNENLDSKLEVLGVKLLGATVEDVRAACEDYELEQGPRALSDTKVREIDIYYIDNLVEDFKTYMKVFYYIDTRRVMEVQYLTLIDCIDKKKDENEKKLKSFVKVLKKYNTSLKQRKETFSKEYPGVRENLKAKYGSVDIHNVFTDGTSGFLWEGENTRIELWYNINHFEWDEEAQCYFGSYQGPRYSNVLICLKDDKATEDRDFAALPKKHQAGKKAF